MGWTRRSRMLLAGTSVAVALATAPAAEAGTYTVYGCKTPSGAPAPTEGWAPADANTPHNVRDPGPCAQGGPVRVELNPNVAHPSTSFADYRFTAPLPIVGFVLYRSVYSTPGYNYDLLEDGQISPENCRGTCSRGNASAPLGETSAYARSGIRLSTVTFRTSCAPTPDGSPCPATPQPPVALALHRSEMILEDESDPEFTSTPAGTLFDTTRELSGVVSASFAAKDTGSGVFQAVVEVDGRRVATAPVDDNGGRCRKPFVHPLPCKAAGSVAGTISLDTAILPDGVHNVRLLVQDATQTNEIPYGPFSIRTRNAVPGRGTPNGTNAGDGAILTGGYAGRRSTTLRARYRRSITLRGRLRNAAGQPVVGARLEIAGRQLRVGAREGTLAVVTTRADGTWSHRFRARASNSLSVRYRAFAGDPTAVERRLTLRVSAASTLRVPRTVRRGNRLVARGRVLGGSIPRGGKIVILQARVGGRWQTSEDGRTDRRGRYRISVPVRRGGGRQVVALRLLVRREASFPYSLGTSRVRRVTLLP